MLAARWASSTLIIAQAGGGSSRLRRGRRRRGRRLRRRRVVGKRRGRPDRRGRHLRPVRDLPALPGRCTASATAASCASATSACVRRRRRPPRTTPTSPPTSSSATPSRSSGPPRWRGTRATAQALGAARGPGPARGVEPPPRRLRQEGLAQPGGGARRPEGPLRGDHQPRGRHRGPRRGPDPGEPARLRARLERQQDHAQGREGRAHDARRVLDAGAPRRRSGWCSRSSSAPRATISSTSRSSRRRGRTTERLGDEALTELAVADALPEGFTTADLAEVEFEGDARARALDLSVADARFAPDVLEAAARRPWARGRRRWTATTRALERVASPEAVARPALRRRRDPEDAARGARPARQAHPDRGGAGRAAARDDDRRRGAGRAAATWRTATPPPS